MQTYTVDASAAIEARVTEPAPPGADGSSASRGALAYAYHVLGYGDAWREDRPLTPETALAYSAVWACVRYISQTIAGILFEAAVGTVKRTIITRDCEVNGAHLIYQAGANDAAKATANAALKGLGIIVR